MFDWLKRNWDKLTVVVLSVFAVSTVLLTPQAINGEYHKIAIAGRKYTPQCLAECHLPINLTLYQNLTISKSDFQKIIKRQIGEFEILDWGIDYLKNKTYNISVPDYENCTRNFTYTKNLTDPRIECGLGREVFRNETMIICERNTTCQIGTHLEERWEYVWIPTPDIINTRANKSYIIDLWIKRRPTLGFSAVDVLLKIKKFELTGMSWWNSSYANYWNMTAMNSTPVKDNYSLIWEINSTIGNLGNHYGIVVINDTGDEMPFGFQDNKNSTIDVGENITLRVQVWSGSEPRGQNYSVYFDCSACSVSDAKNSSFNDVRWEVYDEFEGTFNDTGIWAESNDGTNDASTSGGELVFEYPNANYNHYLRSSTVSYPAKFFLDDLRVVYTYGSSHAFTFGTRENVAGGDRFAFYYHKDAADVNDTWSYDGTDELHDLAGTVEWATKGNYSITWNSSKIQFYKDDVLLTTHTSVIPTSHQGIGVRAMNYGTSAVTIYVGMVKIAKWASPEPTAFFTGSKQSYTPPNVAPTWSNNLTKISSPATYNPDVNYGFEVEWSDDNDANGYNFSYFEHNFTGGSLGNSTTTRSGNVSYFNFTGVPVGTYLIRFYANDSSDAWNKTDQWTYTVNKNSTKFLKLENNVSWSGTYPVHSNTTGYGCPTGQTCTLYRNESTISSGSPTSENILLGAATYNYTYNFTDTSNYTYYCNSSILTISKGTPSLSLTFVPGTSAYYPYWLRVTISETNIGDSDVSYNLYKDDILAKSGVGNKDYDFGELGVDSYVFKFNNTAGDNWTSTSTQDTVTISQRAPNIFVGKDVKFNDSFDNLNNWNIVSGTPEYSSRCYKPTTNTPFSSPNSLLFGEETESVNMTSSLDLSDGDYNISYYIKRGDDNTYVSTIGECETPDSNENITLEYYNSTDWVQFKSHASTESIIFTLWDYELPADAMHSAFNLRITLEEASGANYDFWAVDDLIIYQQNVTETESDTIVVNGTAKNYDSLTYKLYRDDAEITNPEETTLPNGLYEYVYNTSETTNYTSGSDTLYITISGAPDWNSTYGPSETKRIYIYENDSGYGCGPDYTSIFVEPQNQTDIIGIWKICNNGTASGDLKANLTGSQTSGWIFMVGNSSTKTALLNLSTSVVTVYDDFTQDTCNYFWLFVNCTQVSSSPGVDIEFYME